MATCENREGSEHWNRPLIEFLQVACVFYGERNEAVQMRTIPRCEDAQERVGAAGVLRNGAAEYSGT